MHTVLEIVVSLLNLGCKKWISGLFEVLRQQNLAKHKKGANRSQKDSFGVSCCPATFDIKSEIAQHKSILNLIYRHQFYCHQFIQMKAILFASLLVCLLAVSPLDKLNAVARQDDCAANVLNLIKPEIDQKLEELKNSQDLTGLLEVIALMEKGKTMLDKCQANKPAVKVGDVVEWDGVAFLLASNCFKDVGIELLLVDTVIQAPTDYVNDVIVGIFAYILGRQGYADCSQFEHFII